MVSDAARHLAGLADDVKAFRHYLESERGMAANTVLAYGRDLDRFAGWVAGGLRPPGGAPRLSLRRCGRVRGSALSTSVGGSWFI